MRLLHSRTFDIFALSRSRGLAFGDRQPIAAYSSDVGFALGILTRCGHTRFFGVELLRRRIDYVWVVFKPDIQLLSYASAMKILEFQTACGLPLLKVPHGQQVRPELAKLGAKGASPVFQLLQTKSHRPAAWALNQIYLAFPRPDKNWKSDCQTGNFHTRLWEAYFLACFREQGCTVKQEIPSPDFLVERPGGACAWIEAATVNEVPYDHVFRAPNQMPDEPPDGVERQIGAAAVRFAKSIRSKIQKGYPEMAHVTGKPFAIAVADFHAHGSMTWTREALMAYLYGISVTVEDSGGEPVGVIQTITELLGAEKIPAGLFRNPENTNISAIVFSNAATIAKFNRMGFLAGIRPSGLRMIRFGAIFDRRSGALEPIPFELDIASDEYEALWTGVGETWSLELEVFHNPMATHRFPYDLLPECTQWFDHDGEIGCVARHEHSILSSRTVVLGGSDGDFE